MSQYCGGGIMNIIQYWQIQWTLCRESIIHAKRMRQRNDEKSSSERRQGAQARHVLYILRPAQIMLNYIVLNDYCCNQIVLHFNYSQEK